MADLPEKICASGKGFVITEPVKIEVINTKPGDVVVVRTDRMLTKDQREAICADLAQAFGDVKIAVLEGGMSLGVLRNEQGGAT